MLNFTWNLILEYVNIINYKKHLATFFLYPPKKLSHLSNVKGLLLGVLTFMFIFSASYYQCYNPKQWNSIHNAFAFVEKSNESLVSTNAIFQIISRVTFSTLFHHYIKINSSIVPKSCLHKIFLKKTLISC